MNVDMSLDTIIQENSRRGRRGRGRNQGGSRSAMRMLTHEHARAKAAAVRLTRKATGKAADAGKPAASTLQEAADKIMVSGLPSDVNEQQIKELFSTTIGPLRDVRLHCDTSGKWSGSAMVHFRRKGDGTKAYEQYNRRLIDGVKPLKIEIICEPKEVPSLASRVFPAASTNVRAPVQNRIAAGPRRGRGGKRQSRPVKSAADLDAEMEDYTTDARVAATASA